MGVSLLAVCYANLEWKYQRFFFFPCGDQHRFTGGFWHSIRRTSNFVSVFRGRRQVMIGLPLNKRLEDVVEGRRPAAETSPGKQTDMVRIIWLEFRRDLVGRTTKLYATLKCMIAESRRVETTSRNERLPSTRRRGYTRKKKKIIERWEDGLDLNHASTRTPYKSVFASSWFGSIDPQKPIAHRSVRDHLCG